MSSSEKTVSANTRTEMKHKTTSEEMAERIRKDQEKALDKMKADQRIKTIQDISPEFKINGKK